MLIFIKKANILDIFLRGWQMNFMFAKFAPAVFVCLWATGFIGARLGMPYAEPGTFLAIRFAIAFGILTLVALVFKASWPGMKTALHSILVGMLIHGIYLVAVFWTIQQGMPAGVSAVIVGLQPLLTALLAGWLLNEIITGRHWVGLAIGLFGVVLVLSPKLDITGSGINVATVVVSLFGMGSLTLGTILQKKLPPNLDIRSNTALQYLGGFFPVFILSMFTETQSIEWNGQVIFAMVWLVLVLSVAAIFLLMWLIREGSVARVSSLFFMVPAVAAIMAYFLFDETLVLIQLVGMVLCAIAVILASVKAKKTI